MDCIECEHCHVTLPVTPWPSTRIHYSDGLRLQCTQGQWEDSHGYKKDYIKGSLSEINKFLKKSQFTNRLDCL